MTPAKWILLILAVNLCLTLGFYFRLESAYEAGYKQGRRDTNIWFNDQKSTYKDTHDIIEKGRKEGYDHV